MTEEILFIVVSHSHLYQCEKVGRIYYVDCREYWADLWRMGNIYKYK